MQLILYIILMILILGPIYLLVLLYKMNQARKKLEWLNEQEYVTLRIGVPKHNEKKPLAAEQMFAAIHGIYSQSAAYQNHLSFEIVAKDKYIQFYVYVPRHIKDFVEGQIYAQYPTVEIHEVEDYTRSISAKDVNFASCDLILNKPYVYPIKSFTDFEVDPLSGITSVMTKLSPGEEVWFQLIMRPKGDEWQNRGNTIVAAVRAGRKPGGMGAASMLGTGFKHFLGAAFRQAVNPESEMQDKTEVKLPATVEDALKGIEQKIMKLGFETKIRILSVSNDSVSSRVRCQSVAAAFKQFNTTNLNGFRIGDITTNSYEHWHDFVNRSFEDKGNIFNIEELASIYHLPNETVETPNIVWSGSKKAEPPAKLPLRENTDERELTVIGKTNFRNAFHEFGIKKDDRRRHIYIVGKSGTGKSTLIENMAIEDVVLGKGVIVVDPHGELADKVLSCVPDDRVDDVIVFDPADRAFPIGFNLLEHVEDDFKGMVASGFVGIFKKIFGNSWGPRLEHILRNTVLALLDFPNSTMLDIPRMLTDARFRDRVVEVVQDPVIREFWVNEFAQYDNKFRSEAVSPILNKVGQFLATATIRNIVGQPKSQINIREIMDQEKIMVVNLSRGKIGEDNSALLGAMMITKIQLAAMSRADVIAEKRPDCFLYVDEFQNFATESFATILSEARKYNLCLTMANQYIEQMSEEVRSAVFGNAGTIVCFRVGGTDASFLVKEFEPVFEQNDLVNLDKHNIYIKLLIDGISSPAFSALTLPPVQNLTGNVEKIIEQSHKKYSSTRAAVEEMIAGRSKEDEEQLKAEAEAFKQGGLEALLVKKKTAPITHVSSPKKVEEESEAEPKEREFGVVLYNVAPKPKQPDKSTEPDEEAGESAPKKSKPRVFKYQNIIGDKIYKEQTARGGVKWYIGEGIDLAKQEELGVEIPDDGIKMIELAKKVSSKKDSSKPEKSDSHKAKQIPKKGSEAERKSEKKEDKENDLENQKPVEKKGARDKSEEKREPEQLGKATDSEPEAKKEPEKQKSNLSESTEVAEEEKNEKDVQAARKDDSAGHLSEGEEIKL